MRHTNTIAIGRGSIPMAEIGAPAAIIYLPGEDPASEHPEGVAHCAASSLPDAIHFLRSCYNGTAQVAALAGVRILDQHPVRDDLTAIRRQWSAAIQERLSSYFQDLGNSTMDCWEGVRNIIANGRQIAAQPCMADLVGKLSGRAAICLGSGPSAAQYLPEIARLSHSCHVFACDSIAAGAHRSGIKVDFVSMIERPKVMSSLLMDPAEWDREPPRLICSPVIHPDCVEKARNVLWFLNNEEYSHWLASSMKTYFGGRSAGTLSVGAAILAGCNPIYLVGHDLAYSPSGDSHAGASHPLSHRSNRMMLRGASQINYHARRLNAEADSGAQLDTLGLWNIFRADLEGMIAINPGITFVRVGFDGATIAGTVVGNLPSSTRRSAELPDFTDRNWHIQDPRERIPSILRDLDALESAQAKASAMIRAATTPEERAALGGRLSPTASVSPENAWLFRGLFRPLIGSLAVRLNLRASAGMDDWTSQRQAIAIQAANVTAMCRLMRTHLQEEHACSTAS